MADKLLLEKYLCCHICSETFKDPVSLGCDHNFCQDCLLKIWGKSGNRNCPICKRKSSKDIPGVNFTLKELADSFTGRLTLGKDSEEGHELVCSKHTKTPTLFCVTEDKAVCDDCQNPTQHAGNKVISLQEAVQNKKDNLKAELEKMQNILGKCNKIDANYKHVVQHTKSQLMSTEKRIREEFEHLHHFLREEEEARLAALREEEEQKGRKLDEEIKSLEKQIQDVTGSIQRLEKQMLLDNVEFLKGYQNVQTNVDCGLQEPQMCSGLLIDVAQHLGNLKFRVLEKMVETVDYYPVVLDPNTAHGSALLSDDLTRVRYYPPNRGLPDNKERFMKYVNTLGSEGFNSGKHCWDVEVGDRIQWTIGAARESVERKGKITLETKNGQWTFWKRGDVCDVSPNKKLSLKTKPERVRVQLDYERGQVSFYDTNDMTHIYTYKDTFKEKMFPVFSPEVDKSETWLKICPCKVSLKVEEPKI